MFTDKVTIAKAKRRIKRFVKTGEKQARVRPLDSEGRLFAYHAKHHAIILRFKRDVLGRLKQVA